MASRIAASVVVPARVEDFQGHQRDVPIDSRHAKPIIAHSTDRPCYMGPVAKVIKWVAVVIYEIVTIHIVDIAIPIIVNAVVQEFLPD